MGEKTQVSLTEFTRLNQKFNEFREKGYFIDCHVKCAEKFIKCHRLVLSSLSSYFKEKFTEHIPQNTVTDVDIPSEFSPIIDDLIDFFYTGKIQITESTVISILAFGIRYQIPILQQIAEEQLTVSGFANKETVLSLSRQMKAYSIGSFCCAKIVELFVAHFDEFNLKELIQSISAKILFSILSSKDFHSKHASTDDSHGMTDFTLSLIDSYHEVSPITDPEDRESMAKLFDDFKADDAYLYIIHHKCKWAPDKLTLNLYKKALSHRRQMWQKFNNEATKINQVTSRWYTAQWCTLINNANDPEVPEPVDAVAFCRSLGGKIQGANPLAYGFLECTKLSDPFAPKEGIQNQYVAQFGTQGAALMDNDQYFVSINAGAFLSVSFGKLAKFQVDSIEIKSMPKKPGDMKMRKTPHSDMRLDRAKKLGYPDELKITINGPEICDESLHLNEITRDNIKYQYNEEQGIDGAFYHVQEDEKESFIANSLKITLSNRNKSGGNILRLGTIRVFGHFI